MQSSAEREKAKIRRLLLQQQQQQQQANSDDVTNFDPVDNSDVSAVGVIGGDAESRSERHGVLQVAEPTERYVCAKSSRTDGPPNKNKVPILLFSLLSSLRHSFLSPSSFSLLTLA